jgi:hypothetical protein
MLAAVDALPDEQQCCFKVPAALQHAAPLLLLQALHRQGMVC